MERRRALIIGGCAIVAVAGLGFALAGNEERAAPAERAVPAGRQVLATKSAETYTLPSSAAGAVAPPGLDAARPTDCLIEPSQVVRVNSGIEGLIEAVYVDRGDTVGRGQVVARLRSDVDRAGAAAAQARANNVHAERAAASRAAYLDSVRGRSERISGYLARDKVEEAQANARAAGEERQAAVQDRRVAQLEYVRTQRVIAERTVRSPVNGIVTERAMSAGEYRGPDASHILTIAQVDPLRVEVFAPIAQLDAVRLGDEVTIYPEEPIGGVYKARIEIVDRVFDAASGTFGMRLKLPNPGNRLPAGLRCRIELGGGSAGRTVANRPALSARAEPVRSETARGVTQ